MIDPFAAASVRRFEALARKDCDEEACDMQLFALVDEVRREAKNQGERLAPVEHMLERLAHQSEVPTPGAPDEERQGASLRYAGRLRRAADMLRGREKDLTPRGVSGERSKPAH